MSWFKYAISAIIAAAVTITAVAMLANTSGQTNDNKFMLGLETVKNLNDKAILNITQAIGETIRANGGKTTFKVDENPTTGY